MDDCHNAFAAAELDQNGSFLNRFQKLLALFHSNVFHFCCTDCQGRTPVYCILNFYRLQEFILNILASLDIWRLSKSYHKQMIFCLNCDTDGTCLSISDVDFCKCYIFLQHMNRWGIYSEFYCIWVAKIRIIPILYSSVNDHFFLLYLVNKSLDYKHCRF